MRGTACPHAAQKRAPPGSSAWHREHRAVAASCRPQREQKRLSAATADWQPGQVMITRWNDHDLRAKLFGGREDLFNRHLGVDM